MPERFEPTPKQRQIRDHPDLGLLVVAPAGCGKTEALALRVKGLIDRGQVIAPRQVLALTFSKRARDNLRERLAGHLRPEQMRSMVTVSNFHGFAARLIQAHGNVIGMPTDIGIPNTDWVKRVCFDDLGLNYNAFDAVTAVLRDAKLEPRTDEEVLEYLRDSGSTLALRVEKQRQDEGRITYDDMLRLAELILSNDDVTGLYRQHVAALVVDEFQDLTPQQLRLVQRLGLGRTTYAGDLAQGIYTFTGAQPEAVLASIRTEVADEIVFAESHRSSPAVLDVVNALAPTTDGEMLTCANPDRWPGGGVAGSVSFDDVEAEASWITRQCANILAKAPQHRIAVVARYQKRRAALDAAFLADKSVPSFRWDEPFVDKATVDTLRSALRRADPTAASRAASVRDYLWTISGGGQIQDPSLRESMSDAVSWAADEFGSGASFLKLSKRLTALEGGSILTTPGVHLLTGHAGKGQQFDWTIVAGVEEDTLPFFKAKTPDELREEARVLAVMISRARHGAILSRVGWLNGRRKSPSRFLEPIEATRTCRDHDGLIQWLNSSDWVALSAR